jgi:WD40 repeat protein
MRRSRMQPIMALIVVATLSTSGNVDAQQASRFLRVEAAVTPRFEEEGLPYHGDEGLSPQKLRETFGPPTEIRCAAYSPDGKTLAVGDAPPPRGCTTWGPGPLNENGGLVRLVDTANSRVRKTFGPKKIRQHEYEIEHLGFSADGKVVLAAGLDNFAIGNRLVYISRFTVWNATTGRELYCIWGAISDRWIRTAVAAKTGFFAAGTDCAVYVWDGRTGHKRHALADTRSPAASLVFSPDGSTLACGLHDGSVSVWDASTVRCTARFPGHGRFGQRYSIKALAFSPDGRDLAAAGTFRRNGMERDLDYSEVRIFSLADRTERATLPGRGGEEFKCLVFSPDGKTLASGGAPAWNAAEPNRGLFRLWDAVTGAERGSFPTDQQYVLGLSFSPDGRILAAADMGSIVLRNGTNGAPRVTLPCDKEFPRFHEPMFSPDGRTLTSVDGALQLWNLTWTSRPRTNQ